MTVTRRAALLAAVAASLTAERAAAQPAMTTLRVTVVPNDDVTPLLYAVQSGMFRKAGIEIELTRSTSGAAIAAAVAGGSYDIALASMMALVTGHARGLAFTLIAPSLLALTGDVSTLMVVPADSPVRSPRDLTGKLIAVASIRDLNWLSVHTMVDADGGASDTIKFVELPQSALPAALEQGRIDGAVLISPTLDRAMATGRVRSLGSPFESIAKRFSTAEWFAMRDYVERNRDLVDRFARVMLAATIYTNSHHAETAPLIIAFTGLDPALAGQLHRGPLAEYLDPRDVQPPIDAAARYKVIERSFPAQELISPYALKPRR
jgi:NitT/TauT family transport system substrate-binding protein